VFDEELEDAWKLRIRFTKFFAEAIAAWLKKFNG